MDLAKRISGAMGINLEYEWYGSPDTRSYRVSFNKIRKIMGFRPEYDAERAAKEISNAINSKELDVSDPRWITVSWYKGLISRGIMV
ncbi:MAG: hypothetical protein JRN22_04230 [Nitrososphaerota archaeon]|nr:hypothetical protein [Nitrososphaerota archaeon]